MRTLFVTNDDIACYMKLLEVSNNAYMGIQ